MGWPAGVRLGIIPSMLPSQSRLASGLLLFLGVFCLQWLRAQDSYPPHPDTLEKPGTPKGEVLGPFEWRSDIYPGTVRDYHLYVPAQYDPDSPACVMIVQDGLGRANGWGVPNALDNLIHSGEVPVTIGIFISPGVVPAPRDGAQPRFNRSFEYDALGDRYARFLIEEILPEVGKSYNLSDDPNDRLIAGAIEVRSFG